VKGCPHEAVVPVLFRTFCSLSQSRGQTWVCK